MKKPGCAKRNKKHGASLAEMLVTLLILSIAMLAVSGGAASSVRIYRQLCQKANAQTLLSTQINTLSGYLYDSKVDTAKDLETGKADQKENLKVKSIYVEDRGYFSFASREDKDSGKYGIYLKQATTREELAKIEDKDEVPSITDKTQPLNLYADLQDGAIYYSNGCYNFTVEVRSKDDTTKVIESQKVWIRSELMP
jgi:type II secretory pathway pseudopilin PulG